MSSEILHSWNNLLQKIELAKNYPLSKPVMIGPITRNPILDYILPSLLFVNAVSVLDEALTIYIDMQELVMPKKYRNDLNGRVNFLSDEDRLKDAEILHEVRKQRNKIAHEYGIEISENLSWQDLSDYLYTIEAELQHLGFIGDRPRYEFFAESSPKDSVEPDIAFVQVFRYGLKLDNRVIVEISGTFNIHK